jgi:hypothetical protein
MEHTTILGQITEVESVDNQNIDATIYILGTNVNTSFTVSYNDLTAPQKAIVDNYRQLLNDLAPSGD